MKSYDAKQELKLIIYWDVNNLNGYVMARFPLTSGYKWLDPIELDLNKYTSNSSKFCVFKVHIEYPKDLLILHNDYPLAPIKIEIKKGMLSKYQLLIDDFHNILICNVKKLVSNFFDK